MNVFIRDTRKCHLSYKALGKSIVIINNYIIVIIILF
jgi:hypothetical protein